MSADPRREHIRYAQVWEDADTLLAALAPQPGQVLGCIASAGDNALALLTADPARVIAVDRSAAQLACLRLRIAAYRTLRHAELLELAGSRPSTCRGALLDRAVAALDCETRTFWAELRPAVVRHGLGGVGKFERYFRLFRRFVLPLAQSRAARQALLQPMPPDARAAAYADWNGWRWRLLLRAFFCRATMARLGRDPACFDFAEGDLPAQVAALTRKALVEQDPSRNPYLSWILTGRHTEALPLALRPEHFDTIRSRLDRIDIRHGPIESAATPAAPCDGWNLSDVFEYMSPAEHLACYGRLLAATRPGGRLAYWNMMAPRTAPAMFATRVRAHAAEAAALHARDRAFFYRRLVIEERIA